MKIHKLGGPLTEPCKAYKKFRRLAAQDIHPKDEVKCLTGTVENLSSVSSTDSRLRCVCMDGW